MISAFCESTPEAVDEIALAGARAGDTRAFERLYRLHVERIYAVCLRMTANRGMAEDCTQETFVKAWLAIPEFAARSAFGTWLHRIAVNTVIERSRRGDLDLHASLEHDVPEPPAEANIDAETIDELETALQHLPGRARNVVVLYGIYGYSHEETASLMGLTLGACKVQLHRARKLLRKHLREEGCT